MDLTFVEPNQGKSTLTPEQYHSVMTFFRGDNESVNLIINGNTGNVSIEGTEFSWSFDGIDELRLFINRLHSLKLHLLGCHRVFNILVERINKAEIL